MGVPMKYNGEIEFYIEEVNEKHVVSRMPIKSGILNPFGTIHAGAIIWLADVTATVLALGSESIPEDGKGFPLAINLYSNLLSNQRNGEIRAEASFVRKGKQVSVVRTKVTGNNEQLLAEVTTTHIPVK
jgi:1,4-dihydroxy-2-naphthoyl-CoA hydrolase